MELYIHSPHTLSWRTSQMKHGDNFTFYLFNNIWCRLCDKYVINISVSLFFKFKDFGLCLKFCPNRFCVFSEVNEELMIVPPSHSGC
jgi:hypothetical protein